MNGQNPLDGGAGPFCKVTLAPSRAGCVFVRSDLGGIRGFQYSAGRSGSVFPATCIVKKSYPVLGRFHAELHTPWAGLRQRQRQRQRSKPPYYRTVLNFFHSEPKDAFLRFIHAQARRAPTRHPGWPPGRWVSPLFVEIHGIS